MQYEYDLAVEQLKEGRGGLEQYRALVERVTRQVAADKQHATRLEAKVKAYLAAGDRQSAATFAMELQKPGSNSAKTKSSSNCTRRPTKTTHENPALDEEAGRGA